MRVGATQLARPNEAAAKHWRLRRQIPLYVMLIPGAIILALFHYYPMYGITIAFQDYTPVKGFFGSPWVGLKQFERILANPDIALIVRNTLSMAIGKIVIHQLVSVTFALLLNEIRIAWYKRTVQTLSYVLHFLSWMILGGILLDLLSLGGLVNSLLAGLGLQKVPFLMQPGLFQPIAILSQAWKEFGWGAIIYLAALTSIDPGLYEAAAVDGAGRWRRMVHVTLPGIAPTIILLACLNLGQVLNAGMEQVLVLYNPRTYVTADILDTWVYRAGLLQAQYSLATAVGLLKSTVGLGLVALSYWLADRLAGYRVF